MRLHLALVALLLFPACTEQPSARQSAKEKPVASKPSAPYADEPFRADTSVSQSGNAYRVALRRYVAPESTFVQQTGQYDDGRVDTFRYFDNVLDVELARNGDLLFDSTLRKGDFASAIDEPEPEYRSDFMQQATLWRASFQRVDSTSGAAVVDVSLTVPDTDWLEQFELRIDTAGAISVEREQLPQMYEDAE